MGRELKQRMERAKGANGKDTATFRVGSSAIKLRADRETLNVPFSGPSVPPDAKEHKELDADLQDLAGSSGSECAFS